MKIPKKNVTAPASMETVMSRLKERLNDRANGKKDPLAPEKAKATKGKTTKQNSSKTVKKACMKKAPKKDQKKSMKKRKASVETSSKSAGRTRSTQGKQQKQKAIQPKWSTACSAVLKAKEKGILNEKDLKAFSQGCCKCRFRAFCCRSCWRSRGFNV